MPNEHDREPAWISRGKSIRELIQELESFEDKSLEVLISVDDGVVKKPISLVEKSGGYCVLVNCEKV